jgi:adenosine deaminase
VLDTNLNNEYRIAHEVLGMSLAEMAACNRHAVEASFIPESEKRTIAESYFS